MINCVFYDLITRIEEKTRVLFTFRDDCVRECELGICPQHTIRVNSRLSIRNCVFLTNFQENLHKICGEKLKNKDASVSEGCKGASE